jgi:glutathione S-transferase
MVTLYGYNVSPYAAKVRAVLAWKGIAFEEKLVHPARRGILKRLSGQIAVPVIVDGETVVADSTAIVRHLEERYPERPVYPADPALHARALLLEEWCDEGLPHAVQPVRWLMPENHARTMRLFRSAYPAGAVEDALFRIVGAVTRSKETRKFGRARPTAIMNRLAEVLRYLDGALAETGFLAGPAPSVADFAAWGFLHLLDGLDGWETVKAHRRVIKMLKAVAPTDAAAAREEAYDASDQALLDASRLRRSKGP